MNILHKLKVKLAKKSLARLRKGVQARLKSDGYALVCRNIFEQGEHGYYNDERTYRGGHY